MTESFTSWTSLGGNNIDHIGGNSYEIAYTDEQGKKSALQIDYGSQFCNKAQTGYDSLIPDMPNCNDILITHGHADHMAGLPHLLNLKRAEFEKTGESLTLHCTPFAEKMILNSLQSVGIPKEEFPKFNIIEPGKPFEVNGFKVEPFSVSHSIPDAVGFVVESPDGKRMMTFGDFKTAEVPIGKGWDDEKIAEVAQKGIDHLFLDSTSASSKGFSKGEADVKKGLKEILKLSSDGPILSGVISSSCHRLHTVASALAEEALEFAESYKNRTGTAVVPKPRVMILDGASLISARRALNGCGYKLEDMIKAETGVDIKIVASNTKTALQTPPAERFYVCTGTQGEEASLLKVAEGRNKNVSLAEMRESSGRDDLPIFVYDLQSCIPGGEKRYEALEQKFQKAGCTTYFPNRYKENKYTVHASGHSAAEDISKACQIVSKNSPRQTTVVPIHGDPEQRKVVMKIAQDNGLKASIVPNMTELRSFKDRNEFVSGVNTEQWIGVNDIYNDFRKPCFKYDRLQLNPETKKFEKVKGIYYVRAEKKNKENPAGNVKKMLDIAKGR